MNAAETIQAAIEKLEQLKALVTPGDWWSRDIDAVFAGPGLSDDVAVAYEVRLSWDVELIVTLHRTIDAQLDLLRYARAVAGAQVTGKYEELIVDFGLEFARAILGDDS